jgi:hypothetical protein
MKVRLLWSLFLAMICLSCSYSTKAMILPDKNLNIFKNAYLESPQEDEFNLKAVVTEELSKMGFSVRYGKPENPTENDVNVSFSYSGTWDLVALVRNFQVQFTLPKTGELIATGNYQSEPFLLSLFFPNAHYRGFFQRDHKWQFWGLLPIVFEFPFVRPQLLWLGLPRGRLSGGNSFG